MKRLVSIVGGVVLCASVVAGALPAGAQVGGPCSMISDDALSQAVGSSVHALGVMSNPNAASSGASSIAEMCVAQMGGGENGLMITHMVNVQSPGDTASALSLTQAGPGAALASIDPSLLTVTPISGLGDTAVLMSGDKDGQPYGILVVWRGTEGYSLIGSGLADPQTSLPSIAQAIVGQP